jgi:hypothetical protein
VVGNSNDGVIYLSFTNEMVFPPDLQSVLNLGYVQPKLTDVNPINADRLLSAEQEPLKSQSMLTVQMLLTETDEIIEIPWKVTSVIPDRITIDIDYEKPL